mmetsp:Transcript_13172/g.26693  ORF Transcript_13172/g.26693 Transcript_13172/m.26693 type:complete len:140 (+) Transcript_13172:142-561(+)
MNTQYIDITFLATFGLRFDNVLEYFYTSPFYDPNCNNEVVRTQGLSSDHLQGLTGLEYAVDTQSSKEPHLFVIRKQYRRSKGASETLEIFYCLDGIIYQCPVLLDLLQSRMLKASTALKQSYDILSELLEDSPSTDINF